MTTTVSTPRRPARRMIGPELGSSDWLEVPQSDINLFADATHDHQWIHIDTERAKAGPFGGPIAHGYLTLSLLVPLCRRSCGWRSRHGHQLRAEQGALPRPRCPRGRRSG